MPGHHRGRPPRNEGLRYPADPPTVEEIVTVMRTAGHSLHGLRARALIVLLWRAGLRISEALALAEIDLDRTGGSVLVRRGKGGKRRHVGMDRWGWQQIEPWLDHRVARPAGAVLCVISGPTAGRPWSHSAARTTLRHLAVLAGVRRRVAPHQLRHAHAVEMAREGVPLMVIQRQLGHTNPRHHLELSAGHRQHRDHRHRPLPPRPDGPGQHVTAALIDNTSRRCSSRNAQARLLVLARPVAEARAYADRACRSARGAVSFVPCERRADGSLECRKQPQTRGAVRLV
jgi:integrase